MDASDDVRPKSATATPVTALSKLAVNVRSVVLTVVPVAPDDDLKVGVGGSYEIPKHGSVFAGGGDIEPLPAAKPRQYDLSMRGLGSTVMVSTHSVGPPVTAYVTPGSVGNGTPPLKSAAVTPVTGESKVAVTAMVLSVVAPGAEVDVKVALGGESAIDKTRHMLKTGQQAAWTCSWVTNIAA